MYLFLTRSLVSLTILPLGPDFSCIRQYEAYHILRHDIIFCVYTECGISQLTAAHFVGGHILGN
jgi:hypothetical protein